MTTPGRNMALPYFGQRLASRVSRTNIVVLDPGLAAELPSSGGFSMKEGGYIPCSEPDTRGSEPNHAVAGSVYRDPHTGLTVLCTRSGSGGLSVHGRELIVVPRGVDRRRTENARSWHAAGTARSA